MLLMRASRSAALNSTVLHGLVTHRKEHLEFSSMTERSRTRYFVVGLRPVKLIQTEQGGIRVLAYEPGGGGFVRAMGYLPRLMDLDADTEEVDQAEFEKKVAGLRDPMREAVGSRGPEESLTEEPESRTKGISRPVVRFDRSTAPDIETCRDFVLDILHGEGEPPWELQGEPVMHRMIRPLERDDQGWLETVLLEPRISPENRLFVAFHLENTEWKRRLLEELAKLLQDRSDDR